MARVVSPPRLREGFGEGCGVAKPSPLRLAGQARKSRCPSRKREGSRYYSAAFFALSAFGLPLLAFGGAGVISQASGLPTLASSPVFLFTLTSPPWPSLPKSSSSARGCLFFSCDRKRVV